ncbi:MAG TPA: MFS transporter [Anaerolineae bacterium]|nr:MFS transporter [Anaerolineae bacterium]HOG46764.1 MFS transporter [Anaerolineae bacterium]HOR00637.1 MFS transporter [Anaerolineae bacterium]
MRLAPIYRRLRRLRLEPWQRTLYTIVIAEGIAMLGFGVSSPFLPFFIEELGVTDFAQVTFWVGLINSLAPVLMAISSPIWGLLADRYGRKPMLVRAMLGGAVTVGLQAFVANVSQLASLRIAQGALTGTIAAAVTLVATQVPRERCGFALGLLQTAVFVGNSLGPSLGGVVGGTLGYKAAFLMSGLLLFGAGVAVIVLVREEFVPPSVQQRNGNTLAANARTVAGDRILLAMVALLMLYNLSSAVAGPILPLYVQSLVGSMQEASTATGMIIGATAVANALGAVWIARSADRLGPRRVLLASLAVSSVVHLPQMFTRTPMQLLALRFILGVAMGAISPIANAVIAGRTPRGRQGGIFGISTSLNAFGSALGPVLGTFAATYWSLGSIFPVTGAILALLIVWVALTTGGIESAPGAGKSRVRPLP